MEDVRRAKSERLNVRLSADALETIREAASMQQQDVTSFILGAALERARAVIAEDRLLRLTQHEVSELERSLDREPQVVPELASLLRRLSAAVEREVEARGYSEIATGMNKADRRAVARRHRRPS